MEEKKKGGSKEGRKEGREKEGGWMEKEAGRHCVAVTMSPGLDEWVLSGAQISPHFLLCVSLPLPYHEILEGGMKEFDLF